MDRLRKITVGNQTLVILSLLLSFYLTLVYYPGVFYSDSYVRWDIALDLINGTRSDGFNTYLSTLPQVFMALTYKITHNYATFAAIQSFLFFYSFLSLLKKTGNFSRNSLGFLIAIVLFISLPVFQGYSVYYEMSTGVVIAINFILLNLLDNKFTRRSKSGIIKPLYWLRKAFILFILFSILLGFRQNSLTIIPIIIYLSLQLIRNRIALTTVFTSLVLSLIFLNRLPILLSMPIANSSAVGISWETVQILKRVNKPEYYEYIDYAGFGKGSTKLAMQDVEETMFSSLFNAQNSGLAIYKVSDPPLSRRIKKDYLQLILKEPQAFLENKIHVIQRVLGLNKPLFFYEFDENRYSKMENYGYNASKLRTQSIINVHEFMGKAELFRRPYLMFILAFICCLIDRLYLKNRHHYTTYLFLLAVAYYFAFFITTQSYEFRYFFPSFYLLSMIILVVTIKFFHHLLVLIYKAKIKNNKRIGSNS